MPTYYIDPSGGSDTNTGTSWATAFKTISAVTSTAIAPGDTVLIAASPDPTLIGTGTWTSCPTGLPSSINITSSTNAAPIVVTVTAHGYSSGDVVYIQDHATNLTANGTWLITVSDANTFSLDGSAGVGAGTTSGNVTKIPWHCVVITATTLTINRCEKAWNTGPNCTVTADTSQYKEGDASLKIVNSAAITASQLMAYFTISETNFSAYQQISFWLYNSQTILTAGNLTITLCSGTNGTVALDTFSIPIVPSTSRWLPLTIDKGGALGSDVRSIAVNCSGPTIARTLQFDNFIACKAVSSATSLSLQSLISKNSLAQGGTEGWYGIQSISEDGKVVRLDNHGNNLANAGITSRGNGYSTSGTYLETVNTYKRETFKTSMASSSNTVIQEIQDSGTALSVIAFKGGYNTGTNEQTGETFFDGLNSQGYALQTSGKMYTTIDYISLYRYSIGLYYISSASYNTANGINAGNCTLFGCNMNTVYGNNVTMVNCNNNGNNGFLLNNGSSANTINLTNCNNNLATSFSVSGSPNNTLNIINTLNSNGSGIDLSSSIYSRLDAKNSRMNSSSGINFGSGNQNTVCNVSTSNNAISGVQNSQSANFLYNAVISEATEFSGASSYYNYRLYSTKHDGTANNHYIYTDLGVIQSDATNTASATSVIAWKLSPTNSSRNIDYALGLSLAKIACVSGTEVTVTAKYKVSNTTDIKGTLLCRGGQIAGVANNITATTSNADTNYETLTIQFTPGEAGVVEIEGNAFWVANAADESVYIDDMTIDQA